MPTWCVEVLSPKIYNPSKRDFAKVYCHSTKGPIRWIGACVTAHVRLTTRLSEGTETLGH